MTPNERELLLFVAYLARKLGDGTDAISLRTMIGNVSLDAATADPVHPMPDPGMEPSKAPPILGFAFGGPALRSIAARYGLDLRPKESDADLRVRVLDAIARSASAPQGAPRQLSRYVVRYDETQTFQTTALAWSPEEAVRDIQAKIDAGNSLGGREVDGAGPHNVRVVL